MNLKIILIFCFTLDAAILGIPALSRLAKGNNFVQYRALRDPVDEKSPYNWGGYDLYGRPVKRSYGRMFSDLPRMLIY